MVLQGSTDSLNFPAWQRQYEVLISQTDSTRIPEQAAALEAAIFNRLQELAGTPNTTDEHVAIREALTDLRTIQEEELGFPHSEIGNATAPAQGLLSTTPETEPAVEKPVTPQAVRSSPDLLEP